MIVGLTRPIVKKYFRSEVRGLDNIPAGPCLVVGNHSGGLLTPDMSVFAVAYYDEYGYDRPLFTLAHDMLFNTPAADLLRHTGVVRATRENAAAGLAAGAVVMVLAAQVLDALAISAIAASSVALNSSSLCCADSPSVRAREKLAMTPLLRNSFSHASSRL